MLIQHWEFGEWMKVWKKTELRSKKGCLTSSSSYANFWETYTNEEYTNQFPEMLRIHKSKYKTCTSAWSLFKCVGKHEVTADYLEDT